MKITPQKFAIKFKPPRLCLIYEANGESLFHDFPISTEELRKSTKEIYEIIKFENPGYLDEIEPNQIYNLVEKLKQNNVKKPAADVKETPNARLSAVDKFKNIFDDLGIESSDSNEGSNVDYNAVEKSFQNESDSDLLDLNN